MNVAGITSMLVWMASFAAVVCLLLGFVGTMAYYVSTGKSAKAMGVLILLLATVWAMAGVMLLRAGPGWLRVVAWITLATACCVALSACSFFKQKTMTHAKISDDDPITWK